MTATVHPYPCLAPESPPTNWMHEAVLIGLRHSYLKQDTLEVILRIQEYALRSGDAYLAQIATNFLEHLARFK